MRGTNPWAACAQSARMPERNVEIISATAAGGAVDNANRTVQKTWQDKTEMKVVLGDLGLARQ